MRGVDAGGPCAEDLADSDAPEPDPRIHDLERGHATAMQRLRAERAELLRLTLAVADSRTLRFADLLARLRQRLSGRRPGPALLEPVVASINAMSIGPVAPPTGLLYLATPAARRSAVEVLVLGDAESPAAIDWLQATAREAEALDAPVLAVDGPGSRRLEQAAREAGVELAGIIATRDSASSASASGLRAGVEQSDSEWLIVVRADCVPLPGAFSGLLSVARRAPTETLGVVATPADRFGTLPHWVDDLTLAAIGTSASDDEPGYGCLSGSGCFVLNVRALERVGGLRCERYPVLDDVLDDLLLRAERQRLMVLSAGPAVTAGDGGPANGRDRASLRSLGHEYGRRRVGRLRARASDRPVEASLAAARSLVEDPQRALELFEGPAPAPAFCFLSSGMTVADRRAELLARALLDLGATVSSGEKPALGVDDVVVMPATHAGAGHGRRAGLEVLLCEQASDLPMGDESAARLVAVPSAWLRRRARTLRRIDAVVVPPVLDLSELGPASDATEREAQFDVILDAASERVAEAGGLRDALRSRLGSSARLRLLEDTAQQSDRDLGELLRGADMFVDLPGTDGSVRARLAAMACGAAVVALGQDTVDGASNEAVRVIGDDDEAVRVATIVTLLSNHAELRLLQEAALRAARRHDGSSAAVALMAAVASRRPSVLPG
ncbi:MAG: hypothetical protein MSC31_03450 [Solirubrobacteraceae bacterium MAG38_C4-C5]|nr:hypothetical protein [Candidatus Siliceabacter maunaloa]